MFEKIAIIGMGLIGSSLARIIKDQRLAKTLVAIDIDDEVCKAVAELNIADRVTDDIAKGAFDADLIIVATPVGACKAVGKALGPAIKDGAIVTDVGSVKQAVIDALAPHIPDEAHLIPGHPIAGTEHSGPHAGFAELFRGRWCILTPLPDTEIQIMEQVTKLWEAAGSMVEIMTPKDHDLILGITSHLPHLIAYTIVGTANELGDDIKSEVIKYSASGFRDFTRIAASDPVMWRDVFLNNREAVLEILGRFSEDLTALQRAIRRGDGDYLYRTFDSTRGIRKAIIEIGQADYPPDPVAEVPPPVES